MTHSAMSVLLGPEFDAFLFASVDREGNGGSLSVLSALARSDVDPWREAAELAQMPREAANQRLTSLIAALPGTALLAPATIAERLVKLLPRRDSASVPSRGKLLQTDSTLRSRAMTKMILVNVFVLVSVLLAQWALAGLQPPHEGMFHAAASRTGALQTSHAGQINR